MWLLFCLFVNKNSFYNNNKRSTNSNISASFMPLINNAFKEFQLEIYRPISM